MTPHDHAAAWLLDARRHGPAPPFPEAIRPRDEHDAYAIQALVMAQLGPIGGWKVGASGPEAPPNCAPMPASGIFAAPTRLDPTLFTIREVESEIAFRLGQDLPARPAPYETAEVVAAIASCHAAIEVLQPRFAEPESVDALSHQADLIRHGAFIYGPPIAQWQSVDFAALGVTQTMSGCPTLRRTGNPAGDMLRLLTWLANVGAVWSGGLRRGQIVTCGSWTGRTAAPEGAAVSTMFDGIAPVNLTF
jgi:2-keto-4-pentenoate hydratase